MPFTARGMPLSAVVNVRLTETEKEQLKEDADAAGLSLSELVRRRATGRPVLANADAVMIRELRRLGGLLKLVHTESGGAYSRATADALKAVTEYIGRLSRGDRQED